jgi:acyl dehydratase
MAGLYFEEFQEGQAFDHAFSRTVTEMDNTMYSLLTMNPQPLHLDAHFAAGTEWGERLFNSLYTLGIMIGMSVYDTTLGTTVANLGMTDVNFPKPVFHGDTLRAHTKVLSTRASKSRPNAGIVEFEHTATNQKNEVVAICRRFALMRRKPEAA